MGVEAAGDLLDERVRTAVEDRLRLAVHEIRQPLATTLALVEAARSHPEVPTEVRDHLDAIGRQVQETSAAVWSVLGPADHQEDDGYVDVDEVLDSVLGSFAVTWSGTLTRRGRCGGVVPGDRAAIRRCLVNVVDNAVRAAGPEGDVVVTTLRRPAGVQVLVEDDGPGVGLIPSGSGLGLRETRRVLRDLGGDLTFRVQGPGRGAAVEVVLPVRKARPPGSLPRRAG